MCRAIKITESLRLVSIVCVFDQAIYSKALEIKWKGKEKFKNCVFMMGLFHMLMMYMHILRKRFADAGLRDVLIQSNVVAEGSVDKALVGKMYNRGVRMYKLMYEVIIRKLCEYIELDQETSIANGIDDILSLDPNQLEFDATWEDEKLIELYSRFLDARTKLSNRTEGHTLQQF
jgi:hypothetical protein